MEAVSDEVMGILILTCAVNASLYNASKNLIGSSLRVSWRSYITVSFSNIWGKYTWRTGYESIVVTVALSNIIRICICNGAYPTRFWVDGCNRKKAKWD